MAVQIQAYFIGVGGNILEAIVSICSTSKSIVLSDSEFISEIVASRNERLHLLLVDMKLSSGRVERIGTTAAGQGLRIESLPGMELDAGERLLLQGFPCPQCGMRAFETTIPIMVLIESFIWSARIRVDAPRA